MIYSRGVSEKQESQEISTPPAPELGSPLGDPPYGNEGKKQDMIQAGIDYYKNGCFLLFNRPI
jgi:hypothetical protein